jgi:PhnB protein
MNPPTDNHTIQPYLFFEGRCEEALEFYKGAIGAEVLMLMRFKDNPEPGEACQPVDGEKVMHARLRIGNTFVMVSDGRCSGAPSFGGFALTHNCANEAEADRVFAALGDDGNVVMPLEKTFFSPRFGMLTDKFGVMWMILVP